MEKTKRIKKNGEVDIINLLIEKDRIMTLSQIARELKMSVQSAQYHVNKLLKRGIIIKREDGGYMLQLIYYTDLIDAFYALLRLFVEEFSKIMVVDGDAKEVIKNNLIMLLTIFKKEIEQIE